MKPKIFVTRLIPDEGLALLKQKFEVEVWPGDLPPSVPQIKTKIGGVEGLLCLLTDKIDDSVMEMAPRLRVISNYAVGYDNIDVEAATRRGIFVTNTPGVLTETTADLAFALLMACARRLVEADKFTRAGYWKIWGPKLFLGQDIFGATLGLVGLGRIGEAVARRAAGFNMKVLYYSKTRKPELENSMGLEYACLQEVLRKADFVSIHSPLTTATKDLINKDTLRLMKKTAILINTSRGAVVNEKDLYDALKNGVIAGAGLDVYNPEPVLLNDPLLTLDNIIVVPHIGSASVATRTKMAVMAAENLLAVFKGEVPVNLVNRELIK